jgi:hypothetical protein
MQLAVGAGPEDVPPLSRATLQEPPHSVEFPLCGQERAHSRGILCMNLGSNVARIPEDLCKQILNSNRFKHRFYYVYTSFNIAKAIYLLSEVIYVFHAILISPRTVKTDWSF